MGRLLPEDFNDASLQNDAERRVLRALLHQLSDEWFVVPSATFRQLAPWAEKTDYEIDVLLLHEREGIVVLEVKGHEDEQLEVRDGKWFAAGELLAPDPIAQAKSNAYALRDHLRVQHPRLACPGYGVVLPNIAEMMVTATPGVRVLTASEMSTLGDAITEIAAEVTLVNWDHASMRSALRLVAPSAELTFDGAAQVDQRRRLIDDESQLRLDALAGLDVNRRVYVWGGPGTGKTRLAETWARRAARNNYRTLLTCFNVPLAQAMADRLSDVRHVTGLLTVEPFLEFVASGGSGLKPIVRRVDEQESDYWNRVRDHIGDNDGHHEPLFEVIIVDEVQDIADAWVRLLEQLLTVGGHLLLLGDETQRTRRDADAFTPPTIDDGYARCQLQVNLRNTKDIAQLLRTVFAQHAGRPRPGSLPTIAMEHRLVVNHERTPTAVRELLDGFASDGVPPHEIAVLTTTADRRDTLVETLALRRWDNAGPEVLCETVYRAKGLEFDTVVLVVDGDASTAGLEKLLLIGVSRAVSRLAVVGDATVASLLRLDGSD